MAGATLCLTPISRRSPSDPVASESPPTATTAASPACAGATPWLRSPSVARSMAPDRSNRQRGRDDGSNRMGPVGPGRSSGAARSSVVSGSYSEHWAVLQERCARDLPIPAVAPSESPSRKAGCVPHVRYGSPVAPHDTHRRDTAPSGRRRGQGASPTSARDVVHGALPRNGVRDGPKSGGDPRAVGLAWPHLRAGQRSRLDRSLRCHGPGIRKLRTVSRPRRSAPRARARAPRCDGRPPRRPLTARCAGGPSPARGWRPQRCPPAR